jgi:hypothetical protein
MKMQSLLLIGAITLANGSLWAAYGHEDSIQRLRMSSDVLHSNYEHSRRAIYDSNRSFRAILSGKVQASKSTLGFMNAVGNTGRAGTIAEVKEGHK